MNKKRGKKYAESAKLIDAEKIYDLKEAISLVKKTSQTKFDGSIDMAFKLNIDTKYAEQQLRGTIILPHGTGKTKKVLAITNNEKEAKEAKADFVGGKDMIEKIKKENWFAFDVIVASPDMMGELGKIGRIIGPKGLMPNPKLGTVTNNIKQAIEEIKKGKIEYRADKEGNLHLTIGRASFSEKKLIENAKSVYNMVEKSRPSTIKGTYMKNAVVTSTMGPSVKIMVKSK